MPALMLHTRNRTPFEVAVFPFQTADGRDHAACVIKGTFDAQPGLAAPSVSDEQVAIRYGAEHVGEPAESSIRYDSDMWPPKPTTDIVLVGHAHADGTTTTSLDMSLRIGAIDHTVRVFGDRTFYTSPTGIVISAPQPFSMMPLVYERAFGGEDKTAEDPALHAFEERNHIGLGFVGPSSRKTLDGLPLPNIEDPRQLLTAPGDRPPPMGVGFLSPQWAPRVQAAGTFDAQWQKERCPLMPLDFDPQYFAAAHPGLRASPHLRGGEQVDVTHALPGGRRWSCALPRRSVTVSTTIKHREETHEAVLDTVVLEPELQRVQLTWRAHIPCGRDLLYIDHLTIEERGA